MFATFASLGFAPGVAKADARIDALATANRFLASWRMRDVDRILPLLSEKIRRDSARETLRLQLSGLSNPHHFAFEITRGSSVGKNRYRFDIRRWEVYTGAKKIPSPRWETLTLSKSLAGWWVVDELPQVKPGTSKSTATSVPIDYLEALAEANQTLSAWQTKSRSLAFEVADGKRERNGRYTFATVLYRQAENGKVEANRKRIEIQRTGKDRWGQGNWKAVGW